MALYKNAKRGFTLIELMVSMTIFIVFTGVLINSYTSIVRAQQQANEYRVLYTEARTVFDTLSDDLRNGMVDYCADDNYNDEVINLISKDALTKTRVEYLPSEEKIRIGRVLLQNPSDTDLVTADIDLTSDEIAVKDFNVFISPAVDPYNQDNFANATSRFHPKVTIYALFEKVGNPKLSVDFQTTISSRIYNEVCQKAKNEL
jgi:prepilin-type N-terminal cleavage/methylation domain-containing protein